MWIDYERDDISNDHKDLVWAYGKYKSHAGFRGVHSSRKSELFPSAMRRLPNPSPNFPELQNYRCLLTRGIDPSLAFFVMIWWGIKVPNARLDAQGGCLRGMCPPERLENFSFLKWESCNLVNTFGHKFRAGLSKKKKKKKKTVLWTWLTQILHFRRNFG